MRRLLTLLAALSLTLSPLSAAEGKPGLEVRIKSVNDLLGYFEYLGGLGGQGEQGKQFAELIKAFGGEKGAIEGVDLTKPIGGYAVFTPGMVDSQFVVMVPVADEKAFVNLLKNRLSLDAKSEGEGLYQFAVPKVPTPFFFRLHKGYACFTVLDAKHIEPKSLLEPKAFFDVKDSALISVALHVDRIPAEFRKVFLAQFELKLHDQTSQKKDPNAAYRFGYWMARDGGMRMVKSLFEEGRTLSLKLFVEPKSDDLSLVLALTGQEGSTLTQTLATLPTKPAHAALAANVENPVVAFALNAGLPTSMMKDLATYLDEIINEATKDSGAQKDVVERVLDAFAPTLKAGSYEFGVAITGESKEGKLRLVAASKATQGKEIEKLAKEYASFIPAEQAKFEFDVAKLPGASLHKLTVTNDDLKRLYGSESVWAGIGDSIYILGFEPSGDIAKSVANLKPGTSDVMSLRLAGTRLMSLVDPSTEASLVKECEKEVFGGTAKPGSDEAKLTIAGGEQLTITLNIKGKLLEFLTKLDAKKKAK